MKKKVIFLLICLTALTGCGRVDSVDVNSQITPFEIEQTTDENGEIVSDDSSISKVTTVASEATLSGGSTTTGTSKKVAVSLVKRTGVLKKNTVTPNRVTVRVPSRTTVAKTTALSGTTTTVGSTTTNTAVTSSVTTTTASSASIVVKDDMTCAVNDNVINVTLKGEPVQNIEIDTSYIIEKGNSDPKYNVNICDLDFDGYLDLFIPQSEDEHNVHGTFLRFNSETWLFEEWDAFSGISTYTSSSAEDKTITAKTQHNDKEYDENVYEWISNEETGKKELNLVRKKKQFEFSGNYYIDYYEYEYDENGEIVENVVKREQLFFKENGELDKAEEIEIEWLI